MTDTDAKMVLEGRDGYLFLTNDTNRVVDQVEGSFPLEERQIWATAMIHAARHAFCAAIGAEYHHAIVPDRENVLSRYLPKTVRPGRFGPRPVIQYQEAGATRLHDFLYDIAALASTPAEPSFPKNDTHWTWDGAVRYAGALLSRMGCDPHLIDMPDAVERSYDNPGDLGSKIGSPPMRFKLLISPDPAVRPIYDNRLPNVGRLRLTANSKRHPAERWVVLHDSFGEIMTLLLPLCAAKICFVHTSDFDEVFIRKFRPSKVIMLQIERFFVRQPLNSSDWPVMIDGQNELKGKSDLEMPPLSDKLAFA
jgi:alginate O-acetyltransferase complex protein AlgJ